MLVSPEKAKKVGNQGPGKMAGLLLPGDPLQAVTERREGNGGGKILEEA